MRHEMLAEIFDSVRVTRCGSQKDVLEYERMIQWRASSFAVSMGDV